MHTEPSTALVRVENVSKHFGPVRALSDVSVTLRAGEVHGLVGANGAGKSTLIRILAGLQSPDAGRVLVDDEEVHFRTTADAGNLGLNFIHQELSLIPRFSAVQNMALGLREFSQGGFFDRRKAMTKAREVAERLKFPFDINEKVDDLTVPQRWLVAIGRALMRDARLIVMDEPSASLSATEAEQLHGIVRGLKADGVGVVYVSHRLDEVVDLCDRVTVFRDGRRVDERARGNFQKEDLVHLIVGRELEAVAAESGSPLGDVVLEVRKLARGHAVRDVNLTIHSGEVLGIAGLVGSGRTELARILFGVDRPESGEMTLLGVPYKPRNVAHAVDAGVALVPEERRSEGLVMTKSVAFNLNLPSLPNLRRAGVPFFSPSKGRRQAEELISALGIKTPDGTQLVGKLSGGNQQKIVMGKWLTGGVRLLILDEPTKGVDVGARAEIYRQVRRLAEEGMAVVVISSEFEELSVCDRVVVMADGRDVGTASGGDINTEQLTAMCYAGGEYR
jgi:ribose transport system ATP-binding protein